MRVKIGWMVLSVAMAAGAQQGSSVGAIPPVSTTVVVLGTVTPVAESETARDVTVLDAQQHPLAFADVEDYVRTDASVDVQQRGAAGVMDDVSIRGASFEQTLVLLNGLRMDDVETSHFNLDLPVPHEALGGIEVLHGEGSTLYGSDAIGGVANLTTWNPVADTLRLRAGVGSFGENEQGVLGSWVEKRWNGLIAGDRYFSDGFIADRDYRTEDLSGEVRVKSALGTTDVLVAGDDRRFGANDFYGPYDSWERTKGWFGALTQTFDEHTQADVAYRRHTDVFVLFRDDPAAYENNHIDQSYEGDVRETRQVAKDVTVLAGLEETTDQIDSTNLGAHGRNRGAGYAEAEWRVPGRGSLAAGLREEVFDGGRVVSSPMGEGTLWLPHSVKVHGVVGYGFRLPTFLDLYYSDPVTVGNASLKPESAWNYEGGADWYPRGNLAVTTSVFTSRQKDTIDYTRANASSPWMATNLGSVDFTGAEATVDWRVSAAQHVKASYTWLHGALGALDGLESEYAANYAVNNARVEWTYDVKRQVLLESRLGVLQRYGQAAYAVLDVSAVHEMGMWRPYLQMTNLTNAGYAEISGPPPVQMPGRGFVGGVEIVLGKK